MSTPVDVRDELSGSTAALDARAHGTSPVRAPRHRPSALPRARRQVRAGHPCTRALPVRRRAGPRRPARRRLTTALTAARRSVDAPGPTDPSAGHPTAAVVGPRIASLSSALPRCDAGAVPALPGRPCCATGPASGPPSALGTPGLPDELCGEGLPRSRQGGGRRAGSGSPCRTRLTAAQTWELASGWRRPSGTCPRSAVVLQRSIHGQPLDALLGTPGANGAAAEAVRRAASALAAAAPRTAWSARGCARWRRSWTDSGRRAAAHQRRSTPSGESSCWVWPSVSSRPPAFPVSPIGTGPRRLQARPVPPGRRRSGRTCSTSTTAGWPTRPAMRAPSSRRCASSPCSGPWPVVSPAMTAGLDALGGEIPQHVLQIRWGMICPRGSDGMRSWLCSARRFGRFARSPKSPLPAALVEEGHQCLDRLTQELS